MSKKRTLYSEAFRHQIIELVREGKSAKQLSEEFGCCTKTIMNWVAQASVAQKQKSPSKSKLSSVERKELGCLRRQVCQLQTERDILVKATAWFAAKGKKKTFTTSLS